MSVLLQGFKQFLQMPDIADTNFDNQYQALLDRAEEILKNRLGFSWKQTVVANEKHDFSRMLYLNYLPILTTPAPVVIVDGDTLTANEDYYLYSRYIYFPNLSDTHDPLAVDVSYTGGYLDADAGILPYRQMLYDLAKYWLQFNDSLQAGTFVDYRVPNEIKQLIFQYQVKVL